jgi:hypothetical protein
LWTDVAVGVSLYFFGKMVKLGRSVGNVSKDNKSMKDALANAAEGAENPKASRFSVDGIKNMTSSKGVTKTILFYLVYAHEKPQIMKYDNTTNQDLKKYLYMYCM